MDLSSFSVRNLRRIEIDERTIEGYPRGVVTRCILRLVRLDGSSEVFEYTFPRSEEMVTATFEATVAALNRTLDAIHGE